MFPGQDFRRAAFGLSRVLTMLRYEVWPGDPVTFTATALLLGLVALIACRTPARRAVRVDPLESLRVE